MSLVCFRLDLDSTPWDAGSGYGVEQARLVRLFDFARRTGVKFHVFASSRCLRASPGLVDAVLSDGHDLDWLYLGDRLDEEWANAATLLAGTGHSWQGVGHLNLVAVESWLEGLHFISHAEGDTVFADSAIVPLPTVRFSLAMTEPEAVEATVLSALGQGQTVRTARDLLR
ncbi:MAG: hypothetical protein JSS65_13245 [Armatimonadetes bacterium]|nr:hypothetical protein [Armatimonadota bacterium]